MVEDFPSELTRGALLYPAYPFLKREQLEGLLASRDGSFRFEGGYVLRGESPSEKLPFYSAERWLGRGVFTLSDYAYLQEQAIALRREELLQVGVYVGKNAQVDYCATVHSGAIIEDNVTIIGNCLIESNVTVGAGSALLDTQVGASTEITHSILKQSRVGENCQIGPYAYLRPHSKIGNGCRVGDFVEIKNAKIGSRTKISHLSYVGDADLGEDVNVGCGVVFANYNGKQKQRSTVGDGCFLGSNTNYIAPVALSDGAYVAAGTTLTQNLEEDDFCIGRCRETIKKGRAHNYYAPQK